MDPQTEMTPAILTAFIGAAQQVCELLNTCLPECQKVEPKCQLSQLANSMVNLAKKIVGATQMYEKHLQNMEETVRKHIKNQIELKLYYEHLEEVISGLKKDKEQDQICIESLKSEIKQKQKYFMTISNHNTRSGDEVPGGPIQTKIDTITRIKNRLSLNDAGDFLARSFGKAVVDREKDTRDLHSKRENLANTLQKLYDKPEQRSKSKKKNSEISRSKSRKQLCTNRSGRTTSREQGQKKTFKSSKPKQKAGSSKSATPVASRSNLSSRRASKC